MLLPDRFKEGNYRYERLRSKNWSVQVLRHGWEHVGTINGDDDFVRLVSERLGMTDAEVERAYGQQLTQYPATALQ